ncbi:MAG: response regulator [Nitrospirales bacterium]
MYPNRLNNFQQSPMVINILLVEDNDDDIVLIKDAFAEAKFLALLNGVSDGEEALAYLRCEPPYQDAIQPGLILLDINMPKMNGFEVLEVLKTDPRLKSIPVVMLTTSKREEDVVRSYAKGAVSYISKPVDFTHFVKIVREFELYWTLVSHVPVQPN